jgi:tetratricopeptide (TPR) repeat protein
MGKVYRATGPEGPVALKIVHPHLLETPGFFKRFLREAEIGRRVEHANVVRTLDCDALSGHHFLVMEYVEGQTLRELLHDLERVPEELCRHVGREVARGLAAIHAAGVVHRDLKPENVLITLEHVVKVMDLGVARLQDEAIRLSQAGDFVGSLEYAAPEQFRAEDCEPDGRADLYALGVLLYELATGQHPYRDEDASKLIAHILTDEPRRAGEVNPQLSAFLEEAIHTLLAKDRDARFASAGELATVLDEGERSEWWTARAKALRLETKRPLRRVRIPRETALYGRDDDLAKLHALYEKAKGGEGRVLLIEGEAGIGKTRLVDEFVGQLWQAGEDVNFLFGSYPPGGAATAAGAFSTAYREHFGAEGLEDTLEDYLTVTPLLIPAFAALLKGDATPTGAEPLTKNSLQTVFVHATHGLAAERPTIVLIDDLHFAPEDGKALFASLALAAPGHRVLLVGTMRSGMPAQWIAEVTRPEHSEQLTLHRLGPKDLTGLLTDAFRSERLAEELAFRIARKSDGNPFFTFEIIRGLREGQFISRRADGTWVTTRTIEEIEVPSSVLDLVNARVADLDEDERNLLDVAACCGFEFDPSLVGQALGRPRVAALQAFGRIEKRHRLVRSAGRHYVFDHHQVQEALYSALNEQLREAYHESLGDALESREATARTEPAEIDGSLCVDLCEHFLEGARGERALRYLDAALDHLSASFLNEQTVDLADRFLGVPGLLRGESRFRVLMRKNQPLDRLGRLDALGEGLEEAGALAEALGDEKHLLHVEWSVGRFLWTSGSYVDAEPRFSRCLELAREVGDATSEARALGQLGHVFHRLGREERAADYYRASLEVAEACGDRSKMAIAVSGLGNSAWACGRFEEARTHYERALRIARETGDRQGEGTYILNLGNVWNALGRYEEANACYEEGRAIAREAGDRPGEAMAAMNASLVLDQMGRLAEAKVILEEVARATQEFGQRRDVAVALVNLGPLLLELGDRDGARRALERSLDLCRETGSRYPEGYALFYLANVADEDGDMEQALDLAEQCLKLRRDIKNADGVREALIRIGNLSMRSGDPERARVALNEALSLAREQDVKPAIAAALSLLAGLPGGDTGDAEAALEEAGKAGDSPSVRYDLWAATGKLSHLNEAKRLLDYRVHQAPEEYRESMIQNVRLHRDITKAWEEHGEKG